MILFFQLETYYRVHWQQIWRVFKCRIKSVQNTISRWPSTLLLVFHCSNRALVRAIHYPKIICLVKALLFLFASSLQTCADVLFQITCRHSTCTLPVLCIMIVLHLLLSRLILVTVVSSPSLELNGENSMFQNLILHFLSLQSKAFGYRIYEKTSQQGV